MPTKNEMLDFISKIYLKIKNIPTEDNLKAYCKGRWIIMPEN